jgi:hypothetical protein
MTLHKRQQFSPLQVKSGHVARNQRTHVNADRSQIVFALGRESLSFIEKIAARLAQ